MTVNPTSPRTPLDRHLQPHPKQRNFRYRAMHYHQCPR